MPELYDLKAPKKSANLSINSDLLAKSKALNINLSATLEEALNSALLKHKAENWAIRNKDAIHAYNEFIEEHGCFAEEFRAF